MCKNISLIQWYILAVERSEHSTAKNIFFCRILVARWLYSSPWLESFKDDLFTVEDLCGGMNFRGFLEGFPIFQVQRGILHFIVSKSALIFTMRRWTFSVLLWLFLKPAHCHGRIQVLKDNFRSMCKVIIKGRKNFDTCLDLAYAH